MPVKSVARSCKVISKAIRCIDIHSALAGQARTYHLTPHQPPVPQGLSLKTANPILCTSLLQVAEGDRQRLQAALGSSFVRAQEQDMGVGQDAQVLHSFHHRNAHISL